MRIDLHLHTTCSDGLWPPERLFDEVRARELEAFCVSDHDCVSAYPVPADLQNRAIPGLEVDCHHGGHTAHLLAYGIDDAGSRLLMALEAQRAQRIHRMQQMIDRCNSLGLEVTLEDVQAEAGNASSLGRPHLARVLVRRNYVRTTQEAFDLYIADEGAGYVALKRLTSAKAIELIHESGGVAIVAHPMRLRSNSDLAELLDAGADGIEVIHPTAEPADEIRLTAIAKERGLLVTGGTDFHAPVPGRWIGVDFERAAVEQLRSAIDAKRSLRQAAVPSD